MRPPTLQRSACAMNTSVYRQLQLAYRGKQYLGVEEVNSILTKEGNAIFPMNSDEVTSMRTLLQAKTF
jgi:hypothetical protein